MNVSRGKAAQLGKDTVALLRAAHYVTSDGRFDLGDDLRRATEGTIDYAPGDALPRWSPAGLATSYRVANETALAAARRLVGQGRDVVALKFASLRSPGGGFLAGGRAGA